MFSAEDGANPLFDFKGAIVQGLLEELEERQHARQRRGDRQHDRGADAGRWSSSRRRASRGEQATRVAEAEEAGTRKGRSFEERVHAAIERIASARGDVRPHTGGEHAEGGGKKGDTRRRARRRRWTGPRTDRLRGQGQAAVAKRRLERAQPGHGRARRRRSAFSSSPARSGSRRGPSSCTSTRATR